jgi:MFS family permease
VIAQVMGYALAKFIGIRFIAEIPKNKRAITMIQLLALAWLSLLGFALIPAPFNIFCMFLNGIPLGLIWGLVLSYVEGRRATELIGAVLCTSFIFSSGLIKTIGRALMKYAHTSELWMPFWVGLLFVPLVVLFIYLIEQVPEPSPEDIASRTERKPMNQRERREFIGFFLPGLIFNVVIYILLTVMRDIRDNFEVEIWSDLGYKSDLSIYTKIDIPVSLLVLGLVASIILIKNNYKTFVLAHIAILIGFFLIGLGGYLLKTHSIGGMTFMYFAALGLYMAYVPYSILFFERLIATFQYKSNMGFIIYLADSVGYLGSVAILLFKQIGTVHLSWGSFFVNVASFGSILGLIGISLSFLYFSRKYLQLGKKEEVEAELYLSSE